MNWTKRTALPIAAALYLCSAIAHAQEQVALSKDDQHEAQSEQQQGKEIADELAKTVKFDKNPADIARVTEIGQRLAVVVNKVTIPAIFGTDKVYPFDWHFNIVEDSDVNAFSLPGGYVYINSGLLKMVRSDDELAGVLGHEMTHSAHHHAVTIAHEESKLNTDMMVGLVAALLVHMPTRDIANLTGGAQYAQIGYVNHAYSQQAERDADHGGVILMQKAGYDPIGMLSFMIKLSDIERASPDIELGILRDHPLTAERVDAVSAELAEMNVTIDNADWRRITSAPKVSVTTTSAFARSIVFGSADGKPTTIVTLSDPFGDRANAVATSLNRMLDAGLQMGQVKTDGSDVIASDQVLIALTPEDAALQPGATAESLAQQVCDTLRRSLWAQSITGDAPPVGGVSIGTLLPAAGGS